MALYITSLSRCSSIHCFFCHYVAYHSDLSVPMSSRQTTHGLVVLETLVGGSSSPSLFGQNTKLVLITSLSTSSISISHKSGYRTL